MLLLKYAIEDGLAEAHLRSPELLSSSEFVPLLPTSTPVLAMALHLQFAHHRRQHAEEIVREDLEDILCREAFTRIRYNTLI